jgi:hypothetical protein
MSERHNAAAMAILIVQQGCTLPSVLKAALVPTPYLLSVSKHLRQSPLVTHSSVGVLHHAWHDALTRFKAADAAVHLHEWAVATNVPNPTEFARYVRSHPNKCGVVAMSNSMVRPATALNAYDRGSMVAALETAGLAGVVRATIIAEYPDACTDLLALERAGGICTTAERVWVLPPLPPQLRTTDALESSSTTPATCADT